MQFSLRIVVVATLSLALHLTLGWTWTLLAGIGGGVWVARRGWLVGLLGVALGWLALVAYSYAVAGAATQVMTNTVGGMLGNMPGLVVVAATVLIGGLIGVLGGAVGMSLRGLFDKA